MAEKPIRPNRKSRNVCTKAQQSYFILVGLSQMQTDACILWPLNTDKDGYGWVHFEGKWRGAHRVMCTIMNGAPNGRMTLHSCDNPGCVNPRHLRFGTHLENVQDCKIRGRRAMGEHMSHSKLTPDLVREIRKSSMSNRALALQIGASEETVRAARNGQRWKHII